MNKPAYDALRSNQRQLDPDGIEVGVSRQALDQVLDTYAACQTPEGAMLMAIADALGFFWNAALTVPHASQDYSAIQTAGGMVEGVAAVAERLKQIAIDLPAPARTPRIDLAYSQINALGGTVKDDDLHGKGYVQAIDDVLKILVHLGARDVPYSTLVALSGKS